MTRASGWSRVAERGSRWGLRLTVRCHRLFGRPLSLVLVHAIVGYFFLTDRTGRRASRAFLRRVHRYPEGRAALGREPGMWASFLHYRAFALSIFDRMCFWLGSSGDYEMILEGRKSFSTSTGDGRGALVVGAHLGNFDAMRLLAGRDRVAVNVLMFTDHAPLINSVFRELSPDADLNVIRADPTSMRSVFEIKSCIDRGELVAMLADRVEPGDRGNVRRARFLGTPADFPRGPFLLATLLGCPVVMMVALREGPRRYRAWAESLCDGEIVPRHERDARVDRLLEDYVARLERFCLRAPYQWFNFFDFWRDEAR